MTSPPTTSLLHLLGAAGPLAGALGAAGPTWEPRPQQLVMAAAVDRALTEGRHGIFEAATGVGKTFAYLVPLLRYAAERDAVVAVSTSTISLQEQIVRKDLPMLARALPFEVRATLVKGRGNYLCRRRLLLALEEEREGLVGGEALEELEAISAWSRDAREGSLQEVPFRPQPEVWERVRAESGNCLGRACPHYEGCFYQEGRKRAREANLLVLNHHALLADLALRRSGATFLPRVAAIVVDEAHDLEDVAASHLGVRIGAYGVGRSLARLWSPRRRRGLLAQPGFEALRGRTMEVEGALRNYFEGLAEDMGPTTTHPLEEGDRLDPTPIEPLAGLAADLAVSARRLDDPGRRLEVVARARALGALAESMRTFALGETPGHVRWIECGPGGKRPSLCAAPIDVAPLLREVLFDAHDSVLLASATLATGDPPQFDFVRKRLGVPNPLEVRIGSPFDHERQVRLVLRGDLPDPSREPHAYNEALPAAVMDAIRRSQGGALVLFTSLASMERTADALARTLAAESFPLHVQGRDLERPALLERFREQGGALFGVDSFWQGVDVPGRGVRHVVIARLPFEVPTHPLEVARRKRIREDGGDPFRDLGLPRAALRLRQGFGRLIRRRDDEGLVTILDSRIVRSSYGRTLVAALPVCTIEQVD